MIMDHKKMFEFCYGCEQESFTETAIITPFLSLKRFKEHCDAGKNFKGRLY